MIVPFRGSDEQLRALLASLSRVELRSGDELIVSDNRGDPVRTPAYARNQAARKARGEWLVFLDADTIPHAGLLDAYFEPPPDERTAVLAGAVRDVAESRSAVAGGIVSNARMSQRNTLDREGTPYAQTANCAVRRTGFEAVGGFDHAARAGEDADLCFRLLRAGWRIEERPGAIVDHRSRGTLRAWLEQMLVHGSGAAWLERRWPGEFPAPGVGPLVRRIARDAVDATRSLRGRRPQEAQDALLDVLGAIAFELGRLLPNVRTAPNDRMTS